MTPISIYRLSRWFYLRKMKFIARIFKGLNCLIFNCVIPYECIIGKNTRLFHSGLGIVIHPSTTIGDNCNIYNFVVIGGGHDGTDGPEISIYIGNHCNISAGCKILCKSGSLRIGDNCTIAANAVVTNDCPENVVVGGIPAKVLKYKTPQAAVATSYSV